MKLLQLLLDVRVSFEKSSDELPGSLAREVSAPTFHRLRLGLWPQRNIENRLAGHFKSSKMKYT